MRESALIKRLHVFGAMWVLSLASLGAYIGYMMVDTVMPTEYVEHGAKIIPDPVEDGGRVTVKLDIKRNRSCPGTVSRWLINEETQEVVAIYDPVPAAFGNGATTGKSSAAKTFELPDGMPRRVRYKAQVCFQCNPLQAIWPICTKVPDIVFSVIPKK